ncbi:uncharacterized protein LOC119072251 [Bradysia coprophila]|uniref:uncharacterized protein LOC119072251 n=1 Tax=Bradysia coprophila TaxID=38358 RepID=UPI00187DAF50|nr:uncharacterized protein LOC119072251 [Bradysia coprophila]
MKHPDPKSKCVLITHIVNPHQFYYKYTDQIVNGAFSKFDFEIQLYGNELYAQKTHEHGYVPAESELVIFFNVIFNKWIRGRVISIGQEITFWCIDNGVWEKLAAPHVLPLAEQFHKDMNLVHLGGLSLLPIEKTWNVESEQVETQLSQGWDEKSKNLFKGIISTSKTFTFTEEFELENHKFGALAIESKAKERKEINQILLEMNSAAQSHQYSDEDLWPYVHSVLLKSRLYRSILDGSHTRVANSDCNVGPMKAIRRAILGSEMSSIENLTPSEYFDDTASRISSDVSTTVEPEVVPYGSGREAESDEKRKPSVSKFRNDVSKGNDCYDLSDTPSIISKENHRQRSATHEECYLRACKRDDTKNVRQQPLRSTMDWINSMNKSKLSDIACRSDTSARSSTTDLSDNCSIKQTSPASSTTTSRRDILAALTKKGSVTDAAVESSVKAQNPRFGIPAGFSKNCLNSFGGMNRNSAT